MNVIVSNQQQALLSTLDVDVIKSITGTYSAFELVQMFQNFFHNKMILDVTAIKDFEKIITYQTLAKGLDMEKVIFVIPDGSNLCTPQFLAQLITLGIYNFTSNAEGIKYLIQTSNTLKDVEHIQKAGKVRQGSIESSHRQENAVEQFNIVLGIKNVTSQAGSTTFTYILKKELSSIYGENVVALEIDKKDFQAFNDKNLLSVTSDNVTETIEKYRGKAIILIDLADYGDFTICTDTIYLLEPSTIKLNKLIRSNRSIFNKLKAKKVVINKSLLSNKDLNEFEYEAGIKAFYNMPPLNERKKNEVVIGLLIKLGLISPNSDHQKDNTKIFGLFRR